MHTGRTEESETLFKRPLIRTLWLHERHKLESHLLRLSRDDRYLRFGGYLPDDSIRRYCRRVEWWESHLVGWVGDDGALRAVGETRLRRDGWAREAELAFSVETAYQSQGLGSELFRRLLVYAQNRSVARVYITSLPTNAKMRRIARRFGLTVKCHGGDNCNGRIELRGPDYESLFNEAMDEGTGQFLAGLRAQRLWTGDQGQHATGLGNR